jgi:hypothetical protein
MHLQQLSQGRKPSQNLNPEKLRSTRERPTSTIDTQLPFPRELPIAFPREPPLMPELPFPRELPVPLPRELPIAFPRELPLMPNLPFSREPPLTPELPIAFPRKPPLMPELPREPPLELPREPPLTPELPFPRKPPLMSELPIALSASTIDTLFSFPRKLPEQHWSITSLLEEPPVPTRKRPALMTESQIRKLTSAPTREPTALVDHRKIANLKINHIESIDKLQDSHKRFLKVNHKGVPMGIPPVLFIEFLAVNIKGVSKEIPTVQA